MPPPSRNTASADALVEDLYARRRVAHQVKALRFGDASGAYGAYSFYRQVQLAQRKMRRYGWRLGSTIVSFFGSRQHPVIDALFPHISAMSGAEMRELAVDLAGSCWQQSHGTAQFSLNLPHNDAA